MEPETTTPETLVGAPASIAPQKTVAYQLGKGAVYGMIIFGIILFGAIAVALANKKTVEVAMQPVPSVKSAIVADTATAALSVQGSSDNLADIEADLSATDLSSLNDIDKI